MSNENFTTATEVAVFMPEILTGKALEYLRTKFYYARFATPASSLETVNVGDTINVPYAGEVDAHQKEQDENYVVSKAKNMKTVPVKIDKNPAVSMVFVDVARAFADRSLFETYLYPALDAIADDVETNLAILCNTFAEDSLGSDTAPLGLKSFLDARNLFRTKKVDLAGLIALISGDDEVSIIGTEDPILNQYVARTKPSIIESGAIATLGGFDTYVSTYVPVETGVRKNFLFAPGAYVLASRALPFPPANSGAASAIVTDPVSGLNIRVTMSYDGAAGGTRVTTEILYGVAILREEKGMIVSSGPLPEES